MKNSTGQYLYSVCRQAFQEFKLLGMKFFRFLMATPLPRLLVFCIALALLITLIPLVFTLFMAFILLKIMMLIVVLNVGRNGRDEKVQKIKVDYTHRQRDE
jgi:fatty acid desaturase